MVLLEEKKPEETIKKRSCTPLFRKSHPYAGEMLISPVVLMNRSYTRKAGDNRKFL